MNTRFRTRVGLSLSCMAIVAPLAIPLSTANAIGPVAGDKNSTPMSQVAPVDQQEQPTGGDSDSAIAPRLTGPVAAFIEVQSDFFMPDVQHALREMKDVRVINSLQNTVTGFMVLMPGELIPHAEGLTGVVNVVATAAVPTEVTNGGDSNPTFSSKQPIPGMDSPSASPNQNAVPPQGVITRDIQKEHVTFDHVDQLEGGPDGKLTTSREEGYLSRVYTFGTGARFDHPNFKVPVRDSRLANVNRITASPGTVTTTDPSGTMRDCPDWALGALSPAIGLETGVARMSSGIVIGLPCDAAGQWQSFLSGLEWMATDLEKVKQGSSVEARQRGILLIQSNVWSSVTAKGWFDWTSQADIEALTAVMLKKLNDMGVLILTDITSCSSFFSQLPYVVQIGSVDERGNPKSTPSSCVDLWAPGYETAAATYSDKDGNGFHSVSSTALSLSVAGGVAALMRTDAPNMTPGQVVSVMQMMSRSNVVNIDPDERAQVTRRFIHYLPKMLPTPIVEVIGREPGTATLHITNHEAIEQQIRIGDIEYFVAAAPGDWKSVRAIDDDVLVLSDVPSKGLTVRVVRYATGTSSGISELVKIPALQADTNKVALSGYLPMPDGFDVMVTGIQDGSRFTFSAPSTGGATGVTARAITTPEGPSVARVSIRGLAPGTSTIVRMYQHFPGTTQTKEYSLAGSALPQGFDVSRLPSAPTAATQLSVNIRFAATIDEATMKALKDTITNVGGEVLYTYGELFAGVDATIPYSALVDLATFPGVTQLSIPKPTEDLEYTPDTANSWASYRTQQDAPWWLDVLDGDTDDGGAFQYPLRAGLGATIYISDIGGFNTDSRVAQLFSDRSRLSLIGASGCTSGFRRQFSDFDKRAEAAAAVAASDKYGVAKRANVVSSPSIYCDFLYPAVSQDRSLENIAEDIRKRGPSDYPAVVNVGWVPNFEWTYGLFWSGAEFTNPDPLYEKAIQTLQDKFGALVIRGAGDGGTTEGTCEAFGRDRHLSLVVGATGTDGRLLRQSNFGECVDLYAPGDTMEIPELRPSSSWRGTPMAAAITTGWAAILASKHVGSSAADIKAAMLHLAEPTVTIPGYGGTPTGKGKALRGSIAPEPRVTVVMESEQPPDWSINADDRILTVFVDNDDLIPGTYPEISVWANGDDMNPLWSPKTRIGERSGTQSFLVSHPAPWKGMTVEVTVEVPGRETVWKRINISMTSLCERGSPECGKRLLGFPEGMGVGPDIRGLTATSDGSVISFDSDPGVRVVKMSGPGSVTVTASSSGEVRRTQGAPTTLAVTAPATGTTPPAATIITLPSASPRFDPQRVLVVRSGESDIFPYPATFDHDSATWELPEIPEGARYMVTAVLGMKTARVTETAGQPATVTAVGLDSSDVSVVKVSTLSGDGQWLDDIVLVTSGAAVNPPRLQVLKPVKRSGKTTLTVRFPRGYDLEKGNWVAAAVNSTLTFQDVVADTKSGDMLARFDVTGLGRGETDLVKVSTVSPLWGEVFDYRFVAGR